MNGLVELITISPKIVLDIRYATSRNLLGRPVYSSARCFLLKSAAERLHRVQQSLIKRHLGLKVFDGYRPLSVQKQFWACCPDIRFFADPAVGSNHNRGAAVDLTLVDSSGSELPMPSDFDEMSERSHPSYQGGDPAALQNREILITAMTQGGFLACPTEWWHFDDPDFARYPILDVSLENAV
jgi:D-alanyl-D-alanine dipeptidase